MSYKHITISQLTNIEVNYYNNVCPRDCAKRMGIGKDKIYRYYNEFIKGKPVNDIYIEYLKSRKKSCKHKKIPSAEKLKYINDKLDNDWSLDAIAGRDKLGNVEERYSTSTLYRMVEAGIIDKNKLRRKGLRKWTHQNETRGKITDCKTIHERDEKHKDVIDKNTFGHFEGDTIVGKNRASAIVTLVERKSKYMVLLKASRKSEDVKASVTSWANNMVKETLKTITFDRGKEFSKWKEIEEECNNQLEIYFGDPGSPGQRGLNENSNGIIRKDLPKKTDLSVHSQEKLNIIADKWNSIPRKILKYKTPAEVLKLSTGYSTLLLTN